MVMEVRQSQKFVCIELSTMDRVQKLTAMMINRFAIGGKYFVKKKKRDILKSCFPSFLNQWRDWTRVSVT